MTAMRYDEINRAWDAAEVPPITRLEAERAARRLFKRFGKVEDGSPSMSGPAAFRRVRACWVSASGRRTDKGWPRLVHDVSHDIWRRRHPRLRPHAPGHGALELEITRYVLGKGWLAGALRPPEPKRATASERHAKRLVETITAIDRWESKQRRAGNALRKLRARLRRLERNGIINGREQ